MQKDAFKPVGREISVMGMSNPLTGAAAPRRMVQMPQPTTMGRQAHAQAPAPQAAPVGRGAPISDRSGAFKPMGAALQLAGPASPLLDGGPVDRSANFQPSDPSQVMPGPQQQQQELAAAPQHLAQAPRPFLQRQQQQQPQYGETVFRVTMRGRMADGSEYASVYDAVMPLGAQPLESSFVQLT
jgi:hypothetical protein